MCDLASVLADRGAVTEAEALYSEALDAQRDELGPRHPQTLGAMHNMGALLAQTGALAAAGLSQRSALTGALGSRNKPHRPGPADRSQPHCAPQATRPGRRRSYPRPTRGSATRSAPRTRAPSPPRASSPRRFSTSTAWRRPAACSRRRSRGSGRPSGRSTRTRCARFTAWRASRRRTVRARSAPRPPARLAPPSQPPLTFPNPPLPPAAAGEIGVAESLLREALEGFSRAAGIGRRHPRALTCLHNLAQLAWVQGARTRPAPLPASRDSPSPQREKIDAGPHRPPHPCQSTSPRSK